jgi:hypothetical protein
MLHLDYQQDKIRVICHISTALYLKMEYLHCSLKLCHVLTQANFYLIY